MFDPTRRTRRLSTVVTLAACLQMPAFADLSAADDVSRFRLKNRLSVILRPSTATHQVALVVLYAIGEDHDPKNMCGLSHLTEHLYVTAAAGDVPARTAQELMRRYPNAWNAQTGNDYTVFATVFGKDQLERELKEAAARMAKLRPTAAEVDREGQRLLREVDNMYGGFPQLAALNHARQRVRPSATDHRKGGLSDHVRRMTVDDVTDWWSKHYKPVNATLVLAGAFDEANARKHVAKLFGEIPAGKKAPKPGKRGPAKLGRLDTVSIDATSPDARSHVCMAFAAPEPGSEHYPSCLLFINRMWMRASTAGGKPQVTFAVLDDPSIIALSAPVGPDETPAQAVGGLRSFVDQATGQSLLPFEKMATKGNLGVMLGVSVPTAMFKNNLYGVAFSIGRREQLGFDSGTLGSLLDGLTDQKLKAARRALFTPEHQAAVVVVPNKS